MELRAPPSIKVLEAMGAIADGRVKLRDSGAEVTSSDGSRRYVVVWDGTRNAASSDDSGTVHRGYVGYPIIALLMLQGVLPYDPRLAKKLAGVPWKRLNERYGDYGRTMDHVLKGWAWEDKKKLFRLVRWILAILRELKIKKLEEEVKLTDFVEPFGGEGRA